MKISPPETLNLKNIVSYNSLEQLMILKDICHKIYIARNITLDSETIDDTMSRIDKLFRDTDNFN